MADKSAIEWTEATWNPVVGCSKVSPGCAHCYAETLSLRFGWTPHEWTPEHAAENVILKPERLEQPLRWRRPRMVFVNSMSDLFHELVPDAYIQRVFAIMALARRHTFQVLTKRPERALELMRDLTFHRDSFTWMVEHFVGDYDGELEVEWPLPNVWMGVSIENARYTWRADVLREIPAAVRFLSCEPLLGSLFERGPSADNPELAGTRIGRRPLDLAGIDWVIVGGESGCDARPMQIPWVDEIVMHAREFEVAVFVKQLGTAWARRMRADYGLAADAKGGKLEFWPERLRIREMPEVALAAR